MPLRLNLPNKTSCIMCKCCFYDYLSLCYRGFIMKLGGVQDISNGMGFYDDDDWNGLHAVLDGGAGLADSCNDFDGFL